MKDCTDLAGTEVAEYLTGNVGEYMTRQVLATLESLAPIHRPLVRTFAVAGAPGQVSVGVTGYNGTHLHRLTISAAAAAKFPAASALCRSVGSSERLGATSVSYDLGTSASSQPCLKTLRVVRHGRTAVTLEMGEKSGRLADGTLLAGSLRALLQDVNANL